jgi:hypothetical protein
LRARLGAGHYEDGRSADPFTLAGPDVLDRQGCQAGLAVAAGNSGAEPDSDAGGRLQLGDDVAGNAGGQRLAPDEQRDPGRRIWPGARRPDRLSLPPPTTHTSSPAMAEASTAAAPGPVARGRVVRACTPCMSAWTPYTAQVTGPGSSGSPARDCCDNRTLTVAWKLVRLRVTTRTREPGRSARLRSRPQSRL